jgi:hypothetical protein
MAVTVSVKREFEFIVTDSGSNPSIIPRDFSNPVCAELFNLKSKIVDNSLPDNYLAFPYILKIGTSFVGIYSDSDAHASGSNGQWMIRSDDNGATWSKVLFFDADNPTIFNTSLLTDLLGNGDTATLKIWTVKNTAGIFSVTSTSTVSYGGNTYALWSRPITGPGGILWRTGYALVSGVTQTALFSSSDGGLTWAGVSVIFADPTKYYSEADIVQLNGTNWIAIVREDSTSSLYNSLYYSISTNDGSSWGSPVLFTQTKVNGRQPNLIKITNGDIILSTGDRKTGSSGYASDGTISNAVYDTTGITIYKKPLVSLVSNPLTTSGGAGTTTIVVTHDSHGYVTNDVVFIYGAVGFDGIPTAELNGLKTITKINNNSYSFTTTTGATAGGVSGGGSSVKLYNITQFGFRTRIAGMYSSDGGQPYTNETSTANRVNTVFYHRRGVEENPIIASCTFDTEPL